MPWNLTAHIWKTLERSFPKINSNAKNVQANTNYNLWRQKKPTNKKKQQYLIYHARGKSDFFCSLCKKDDKIIDARPGNQTYTDNNFMEWCISDLIIFKCYFLDFDIFPEFVSFKWSIAVVVYIIILNKYLISHLIIWIIFPKLYEMQAHRFALCLKRAPCPCMLVVDMIKHRESALYSCLGLL